MINISTLTDQQLALLVENRWASSSTVWDIVKKTTEKNKSIYKNEPEWSNTQVIGRNRARIRANRIFRDMESVINTLIANPPQPNILPTRNTPESKKLAQLQEKYFLKKYTDLNVKEQIRKGYRHLYFSRLFLLKPFWNTKINDFDVRALDPNKVRVGKTATKETDSEFVIEEVDENLDVMIDRFPDKKAEILKESGFMDETTAYIQNPSVTYKEAWIQDYVVFKYRNIIIGKIKNPYWDWDGLLLSQEEMAGLEKAEGTQRRSILSAARSAQQERQAVMAPPSTPDENEAATNPTDSPEYLQGEQPLPEQPQEVTEGGGPKESYNAYYFNHFDMPRKPYIWGTILNSENKPIGDTDFITQAAPLQESIDRRKIDIDENASLVNGQVKVDSSVMSKADAQKLRYEARGVIWGKGVAAGVTREMGTPLPAFVFEDMKDSRNEIDNIMGASAAFRGEREGQETKAGRLALIDQSYLALNELVQVGDYMNHELFNWFFQLAKVNYTERHYAKTLGKDAAIEIMELMQDDFEDGTEVKVISGKTLPEDRQFKMEQAQVDVEKGILSPVDYLEIAGYNDPQQKAKNRATYNLNPAIASGLTPEEISALAPPKQEEDKPPSASISFKDLPPDGQIQLAQKAGITLNPALTFAAAAHSNNSKKKEVKAEDQRTNVLEDNQ